MNTSMNTMTLCITRAGPRNRGFGAMAALLVVVIFAAMAAAVARLGWTQQTTFSQDLLSARANQAARAGVEWGMYQALKSGNPTWTNCSAATSTLDLRNELDMWVTVSCNHDAYNEGESSTAVGSPQRVRVYTIEAVACNGASACPDNAAAVKPYYVERKQQVILSMDE